MEVKGQGNHKASDIGRWAHFNIMLLPSVSGKILTIETVPLKLPRRYWDGPEVDPDQTFFPDEYLRHVLYITRIYFISGEPEEELIGKYRYTKYMTAWAYAQ